MGSAPYIRLEQVGGPTFEVAILCTSNIILTKHSNSKVVQIVHDIMG